MNGKKQDKNSIEVCRPFSFFDTTFLCRTEEVSGIYIYNKQIFI